MESILKIQNEHGNDLCHIFRSEKVFRKDFFLIHKHTSLELSLIVSGDGKYLTPSGSHAIRTGDIFLYRPNEQHCITDAENLSLLNLHFSPRFFADSEAVSGNFLSVFGAAGRGVSNRLPHDTEAAKRISALLCTIRDEALQKPKDFAAMIRAKLTEALILLHRQIGEGAEDALPASGFDKINRAADYMDEHFTSPLTLGEIAAHVHLTRTYFSSLFKSCYGMTPWDYINIRRTELAKHLLAHEEDTILSIALRCGFNNTANFNRIFKAVVSTTPREYRKAKKAETLS